MKGIEINAYAAELARVSVWIGEIPVDASQWVRRIDRSDPRPRLETIECRDADRCPGRDRGRIGRTLMR